MPSNSSLSEKENRTRRRQVVAEKEMSEEEDASMSSGDERGAGGKRKIAKPKPNGKGPKGKAREEEDMDVDSNEEAEGAEEESEEDYDPNQDKEEKRKIRRKYREKLEAIDEIRGALAETGVDELTSLVKGADKLFSKVKAPQEATLDSRLLVLAADLGSSKIRALKVDSSEFDMADYIVKLRAFMGGRRLGAGASQDADGEDEEEEEEGRRTVLDWKKVGQIAMRHCRAITGADFMNGPLSIVKEKRVIVRTQRARVDETQRVRPQELTKDDIVQSENSTDKIVKQIHDILDGLGPNGTDFVSFIFNPESFSQTVENLFYFSFLIREGKACLEETDEGGYIVYCTDPADEDEKNQGMQKLQLVLELTEELWEEGIDNFGLRGKAPIIPSRRAEAGPTGGTGGQWYG
ncbi:Nse4-domain-containing protein [Atractiella rhizophila]|nr:Nse4-domain-containing protein [Atractiella rhizophila]